jgi:hypothetical protein
MGTKRFRQTVVLIASSVVAASFGGAGVASAEGIAIQPATVSLAPDTTLAGSGGQLASVHVAIKDVMAAIDSVRAQEDAETERLRSGIAVDVPSNNVLSSLAAAADRASQLQQQVGCVYGC